MKKGVYVFLCLFLLSFVLLVSCQNSTDGHEDSSQESGTNRAIQAESSVSAAIEPETNFTVISYPETLTADPVFHWAILHCGRNFSIDDEVMLQVNERLKGLHAGLQFHLVSLEQDSLITPEVIEKVKDEIGGQIDFISMSPTLTAFNRDDWDKTFIDIEDDLKQGGLKDFYEMVPPRLWEINQIAGGYYSFSNAKQTQVLGLKYRSPMIEKMGKENIKLLPQAKGLENEELWRDLYDIAKGPLAEWNSWMNFGTYDTISEQPYSRTLARGYTNGLELQYFEELTPDIQFNIVTNQYEWLGSSDTYIDLQEKLIAYYQRGYIEVTDLDMLYGDQIQDFEKYLGRPIVLNTSEILYDIPETVEGEGSGIIVPLWDTSVISKRPSDQYLYSCVYKEAQEGWQNMLNLLGTDSELTQLIHNGSAKTDSFNGSELYISQEVFMLASNDQNQGDPYAVLQRQYENAQLPATGDFVFNPQPVYDELMQCERVSYALAPAECKERVVQEDGSMSQQFSLELLEKSWDNYQAGMKDTPIEAVVEEVNRQYREWISK